MSITGAGQGTKRLVMVTLILVAMLAAERIFPGEVYVADGDTIEMDGERIRLWGIDAPELAQSCEREEGSFTCGKTAKLALTELIGSGKVLCEPKGKDRYRRTVAVCRVNGLELGAAMVARGWAVDYAAYSHGYYRAEEAAARTARLGIWSARFELPAEWRQRHRQP